MYNIEKEIQEILDPLIFNASHELKGHCLFEHVISDRDLLLKLKWMRKAQGNEIVLASRFFSAEQARKAIYKYKIINTCLVAIIVVETAIIFSPVLTKGIEFILGVN